MLRRVFEAAPPAAFAVRFEGAACAANRRSGNSGLPLSGIINIPRRVTESSCPPRRYFSPTPPGGAAGFSPATQRCLWLSTIYTRRAFKYLLQSGSAFLACLAGETPYFGWCFDWHAACSSPALIQTIGPRAIYPEAPWQHDVEAPARAPRNRCCQTFRDALLRRLQRLENSPLFWPDSRKTSSSFTTRPSGRVSTKGEDACANPANLIARHRREFLLPPNDDERN
jgi:hypothetical protein